MSALTTWLTAIADAIRGKDGTALPIDHIDFPAKIAAIPQLDTSDATALVTDILAPKTAYVDGEKITGTCTYDADTSSGDAVAADLALGKKAWVDGEEVTGILTVGTLVDEGIIVLSRNESGYATAVDYYGKAIYAMTFRRYAQANNFSLVATINLINSVTEIGTLAFDNNTAIATISGQPINLENSSNKNPFHTCSALVTISFVPNTILEALSFALAASLSTASLLSIANGLHQPSAPNTLTMHATSKTNMDNIMVDNNAGMAVAGSAMTLTAFITNIKGWTVA